MNSFPPVWGVGSSFLHPAKIRSLLQIDTPCKRLNTCQPITTCKWLIANAAHESFTQSEVGYMPRDCGIRLPICSTWHSDISQNIESDA